tara:strand:- start:4562 stop:4738 length:177 start_codon:yes stop_codon:yes gene_type:complete
VLNIGSGGFPKYSSYSTSSCHFLSHKINIDNIFIGVFLIFGAITIVLGIVSIFINKGD